MRHIRVSPLVEADRSEWEALARAYQRFYEIELPALEYERTWLRLMSGDTVHGVAGRNDGKLVGIAHYLFHTTVWDAKVCYLQDVFVAPEARRQGVGRALIEAVAHAAREASAARYYWLTRQDNATARALYDQVAEFNGFIRYNFRL